MGEAGGVGTPASDDDAGLGRWAQAVLRVTDGAVGLGVDELLDGLLERVVAEIGVDSATVLLLDEHGDELVVRASRGQEIDLRDSAPVAVAARLAGRVAAERRPVVVSGPGPADVVAGDSEDSAVSAALGVPLLVAGRVTGVLHVASVRPRRFSADEVALLELVADRAARAVEHAALFEREHQIAETLQRSLLPGDLPEVDGLEVCARYVPGSPGTTVGGDWYDVIPLPGRRVGLVIGDVAGRGTRAAAVMGLVRNALRAYACEGHRPGRVVELLDRLLQMTEPGEMVTLAYAVVDLATGTTTLTSAGHPPPLLAEGGASRFVEAARSVPLGVVPDATRPEAVVSLPPGARLVLYTDGLVERRTACLDHGLARLRQAVDTGPDAVAQLCNHLLDVLVHAEPLGDDAAVLVVRRAPPASAARGAGRPR